MMTVTCPTISQPLPVPALCLMLPDGAARFGRRTPEPHVWPAAPSALARGDSWRGAAVMTDESVKARLERGDWVTLDEAFPELVPSDLKEEIKAAIAEAAPYDGVSAIARQADNDRTAEWARKYGSNSSSPVRSWDYGAYPHSEVSAIIRQVHSSRQAELAGRSGPNASSTVDAVKRSAIVERFRKAWSAIDVAVRRRLAGNEWQTQKMEKYSAIPVASCVWDSFRLYWKGESADEDKPDLFVSGPIECLAETRDAEGNGWGVLFGWTDRDGVRHEEAFARAMFSGDCGELRSRLANGGLTLASGPAAKNAFSEWMAMISSSERARSVARIGWHEFRNGSVFVLASEAFGRSDERVVLQQESPEPDLFNVSGTAEEWRDRIGIVCRGNSRLVLAASAAFAAPLLTILGEDGGGLP